MIMELGGTEVASLRRSGINGNVSLISAALCPLGVASLRRSGINGNAPSRKLQIHHRWSLLFGEVELMETP